MRRISSRPEGADAADVAKLRSEAIRFAMFDPSKEANLARKYENAAERSFFRCLKELQRRDREARVAQEAESDRRVEATMGSFLEAARTSQSEDAYFDAMYRELNIPRPSMAPRPSDRPGNDVPVTASRPR